MEAKREMTAAASTPGAQDAPCLGQRPRAVGGLGQVVERAEREDGVGARVGEGQLAGVADPRRGDRRAGLRGGGRARLVDVQRHRVEQVDLVARARQRQRVGARGAADVEHDGRRGGQEALEQLDGAQELQPAPRGEAPLLVAAVVEAGDLRVDGHGPERRALLE